MKARQVITERMLYNIIENVVTMVLESSGIGCDVPSKDEYEEASYLIDNARSAREYNHYKDIIDRYERAEELYWRLSKLSNEHQRQGRKCNSHYIMTNGKIISLNNHNSVSEIDDGLSVSEMLKMGHIRLIGGMYDDTIMIQLSKPPTDQQRRTLWRLISSCSGTVYVDVGIENCNSKVFDRTNTSAELAFNKIMQMFD